MRRIFVSIIAQVNRDALRNLLSKHVMEWLIMKEARGELKTNSAEAAVQS
jgi:hypothetical protein